MVCTTAIMATNHHQGTSNGKLSNNSQATSNNNVTKIRTSHIFLKVTHERVRLQSMLKMSTSFVLPCHVPIASHFCKRNNLLARCALLRLYSRTPSNGHESSLIGIEGFAACRMQQKAGYIDEVTTYQTTPTSLTLIISILTDCFGEY